MAHFAQIDEATNLVLNVVVVWDSHTVDADGNEIDGFSPPQPFPSWTLNEETCQWEPPIPRPEFEEGKHPPMYGWNEDEQKWEEIINQ